MSLPSASSTMAAVVHQPTAAMVTLIRHQVVNLSAGLTDIYEFTILEPVK